MGKSTINGHYQLLFVCSPEGNPQVHTRPVLGKPKKGDGVQHFSVFQGPNDLLCFPWSLNGAGAPPQITGRQ